MKLIDADALLSSFEDKRSHGYYNAQYIWRKIKESPAVLLSCPKCHGKGTYRVPTLDENGEWGYEWESRKCEVCNGTGKITLEFYEELQRGCRR